MPSDSKEPEKRKDSSLYKELHKRDLFKVSIVYIVLGMIIWKIIVLLTPVLNLPPKIFRVTAIFLFIFFPIALVLAWIFEMAPEGFVKVGSKASHENPYSRSLRKPLTNNIFILILLIIMLILYIFFPTPTAINNI